MASCGMCLAEQTKPYWDLVCGQDYEEIQRDIMAKWIERKKWLKDNLKWDRLESRVQRDQLYRRFQTEKEERMMQDCLCKTERDKIHRQRQIVQETNFAESMKELKESQIREAATKKQMHACVPELRDLEHQLRRAYYAKTLYAQRLEKQAKDLEEKMRQHQMHCVLMESLAKSDEAEAERDRQRLQAKCEYRQQLENQLTDETSKAAKELEQLTRDKAMVDEIMESIKQEEIDDLIEKTNKVKLYQDEVNNFMDARQNQRRREKERQIREEERDAAYLNTKQEQKQAFNQARAERDKAKAAIIAKAVEQMMQAQFRQEELEDLKRELYEEELAEKIRREDAEEVEKKCRTMKELQEAEAEAKRFHAEKLAAEKEEEDKYKEELLAKFAEDDRLEQLGTSRRRQKQREHQAKVVEMMLARRALRAQEVQRELETLHCAELEEKRRQELIDKERCNLLRQHGPNVLGFIPCGTIKSQQELECLGEPLLTYYRNSALFTEPDPTTVDFSECEEALFKTMDVPKNVKY